MRVFPTVAAVDVYLNSDGDVVITQADPYGGDSENVIIPAALTEDFLSAFEAVAKGEAE